MSGIVGTAGHIDHGKTTLVARLTGIDTDRLPEEKRRGITIALGFAPIELPGGRRAGLIDVPGHERFVRTMVSGAVGIDVALLVVAADEGVMPQTREHLEICGLLGVRGGVVALTKLDKAGADLAELARADVEDAIEGTFLAEAKIVACSARTGEGLEDLRSALAHALEAVPPTPTGAGFFLPIDRVLSVKGFGTVVTGTVLSGDLAVGDSVEVGPSRLGRRGLRARVRSLQEFGNEATSVSASQRAAIALAGIDAESIQVGAAVVTCGSARPTRRLSVRVHHLSGRERDLRTSSKVSLHIGTMAIEAGLTLFERDQLPPGETALATLRLGTPVMCLPGQRFILRGFDAPGVSGRTLGGGLVLDPEPGRRRRKVPATLELLKKLETRYLQPEEPKAQAAALSALTAEAGPRGLLEATLARRLHLSEARVGDIGARLEREIRRIESEGRLVAVSELKKLQPELAAAVRRFHEEQPVAEGVSRAELATRVGRGISSGVVDSVVQDLVKSGRLFEAKALLRDGQARADEAQANLKRSILEALDAQPLEPPTSSELPSHLGLDPGEVRAALSTLARERTIVNAGKDLYFTRGALDEAGQRLLELIAQEGPVSTARAKAMYGISRKYLIPLLEALDRLGVTARRGEVRVAR